MVLWFLGLGVLSVWVVFRSPALDYRLVMLGSVLPLLDGVFGEGRLLHTIIAPVVLLTAVMLWTRRRRLVRRRLLGVPIGMFLHLVLDGTWARAETFWWPLLGDSSDRTLPEFGRGGAATVAMEVAGAVVLAWCWRRFDLAQPRNRTRLARTGQLPRLGDDGSPALYTGIDGESAGWPRPGSDRVEEGRGSKGQGAG